MKRLALAIVCGFIIPFLYAIIAVPLSSYITNPTLDRLLMFPVRWPILILSQLHFLAFENEIIAISVYLVACNVILYSILSYFLLWGVSKRKNVTLRSPPEPPSFVQN